jgi:hypothetical protein
MRRVVLGSLLSFACFACAQQPVGDVYESGAPAETPAQAVQKLYDLTAEITADPSSGYDAKTDDWPEADAAWNQWDNSIGLNGNALTQQQRGVLVPCAANLDAAINSAEQGYRIQISQQGNAPAQAAAQQDYARARSEFAQCNLADGLNGSNGNPATGGPNPGSQAAGTSGGGSNPPVQGGVSTGSNGTPGTTDGGDPGAPQTTGTQPGSPASPSPAQPPGAKGISRTPATPSGNGTQPPAGADIATLDKTMNACLREHVPYWKQQAVDPASMAAARTLFLPDAKQSTPMNELPANSQIFLEAAAYGVQAFNAHTSYYGLDSGAGIYKYSLQDAADYMTGWLYHCMYRAQLTPQSSNFSANDPPLLYSQFLDVPETDARVNLFSSGFKEDTLPPLPMLPPGQTVFPLVLAPN